MRIILRPGDPQTIEIILTADELSFLDKKMEWVVDPGKFELMIVTSSSQAYMGLLEV
jgi:beta-glucosidase